MAPQHLTVRRREQLRVAQLHRVVEVARQLAEELVEPLRPLPGADQIRAAHCLKLKHEGDRLAPERARVRLQHLVEEKRGVQEVRIELTGVAAPAPVADRSEERRVGKECRSRWSPYH